MILDNWFINWALHSAGRMMRGVLCAPDTCDADRATFMLYVLNARGTRELTETTLM